MNLNRNLDVSLNTISDMLGNSNDITKRIMKFKNKNIAYIFLDSTTSNDKVTDSLLKSLTIDIRNNNGYKNIFEHFKNTIPASNYKSINTYSEVIYYLSSGYVCILIDGYSKAIILEVKRNLDRSISEPTTETVIRGPKDCFTENYNSNIGLIRRRIKDSNLWIKELKIGRRSKTNVGIIYLKDIADISSVNNIYQKLKKINIDAILDSGYLRDFLVDDKSFFPLIISTERPDAVCGSILEGKIAIMVENSPFALILPAMLIDFFHTPEDYYDKSINVTFSRLLRLLAFIITIITPALYIAATTFNIEIIPDSLLISIATQREGVPFPTVIEVLILITTFELLRESDIRLPSIMGTSMSVVGALVLGEAAVNAGIVSAIVVIISAITSITCLLFSDIDVINAYRWWRLIFIIFSAFLGIIGFFAVFIVFVIKLCSLKTLNIPYLTPISPFFKHDLKDTFLKKRTNKDYLRPSFLTKNKRRLK